MKKQFLSIGALVALIAGATVSKAQDVPWQVHSGDAAVQFWSENLRSHGLEVVGLAPTAFGNYPMEGAVGFTIQPTSSMQIMPEKQVFGHHLGGAVRVKGGFYIRSGKRMISMMNFLVKSAGADAESPLDLYDGVSTTLEPPLVLEHPLAYFDAMRGGLTLGFGDLKISRAGALSLGRPELEGLLIGGLSVFAKVRPTLPIGPITPIGNGLDNNNADVQLFNLSSFTSVGRTGTYPNGTTGFSTLTTSCNKGQTNIDWYAPMNENHPVIVQNLYCVRDGRIEQFGAAYLKHGFLATNTSNSNCGVGQHPGTGSLLGPGLTDTYGTGNNSDRYYLGPRSEVNPFTGEWTAWGSWFDLGVGGTIPDGQRSLTSSQANSLPAHQNRIEVRDADLVNPTSEPRTYVYEAFYLCEQEINLDNQIGCRQTNISWSGSAWSTMDSGAYMEGKPAIMRYVELVNAGKNVPAGDVLAVGGKVSNVSEGVVYVAANPIRLGGGLWRYEFAVFNYTSDRQIREVKIPVLNGMTVTNIGFRDTDQNAANNWTGTYSNGQIVWATETQQQNPNANSLKYGYIYNFSFTANVPPVANTAYLGMFKSGSLGNLTGSVMAPPPGTFSPASFQVILGIPAGGGLAQILTSDNQYAVVNQDPNSEHVFPCQSEVTATSTITNPGSIKVTIESAADLDGRFEAIQLYNWNTNSWDTIGTGVANVADSTKTYTVNSGAANYVNGTTKQVKARLNLDYGSSETVQIVVHKIDLVSFEVTL